MLLLVSGALLATGLLAAAALFPARSALERALVGVLLANAAAIGLIEVLSLFSAISRPGLVAGAGLLTAFAVLGVGAPALARLRADGVALQRLLRRLASEPLLGAPCGVALAVLVMAVTAAWALSPWTMEGLTVHLPLSDDAIQAHVLRPVPTHLTYVNASPHLGAVYLTAFRLALGSDTFGELAQAPFAVLAVLAIALVARREGVPTARAVGLALLFVAVPVVQLELATTQVDLMFASLVLAAFVLASGPLDAPTIGLAALALGLALGTDASAPLVILAGLGLLAIRGLRAARAGEVLFAAGVVVSVGGWSYVENLVLHGNPLWPAAIALGPLRLEGPLELGELATRGLGPPSSELGWAERLLDSWLTPFEDRVHFDMRRGGLGPTFTLALVPIGIAVAVAAAGDRVFRARMATLAAFAAPLCVASLATPFAYWPRYTMVLPGALLAVSVVATQSMPAEVRRVLDAMLVLLATIAAAHAAPGFTYDGPPLHEVVQMPTDEREVAFGIDGDERPWRDARARIEPGEAFAYDPSFSLAGRLFAPHQRGRVEHLPLRFPTPDELVESVDRVGARMVVLGEGPHFGGADAARARPERFRFVVDCAPSLGDACSLFEVLPSPRPSASPGEPTPPPPAPRR